MDTTRVTGVIPGARFTKPSLDSRQESVRALWDRIANEIENDRAGTLADYGWSSLDEWYRAWCESYARVKLDPPARPAIVDEAPPRMVELVDVVALGRKLEVGDVTPAHVALATEWLAAQTNPDFAFLIDMKVNVATGRKLTPGQAKGVLNCAIADASRRAPVAPVVAPVTPGPVAAPVATLVEGVYLHDGLVYKVQAAVHGSGHLYAKRLVVDEAGGKGRFEYIKGMIRQLQPEEKMSLEQAREYGALYGVCCVCGAVLTDERSIERGIGPICEGRLD